MDRINKIALSDWVKCEIEAWGGSARALARKLEVNHSTVYAWRDKTSEKITDANIEKLAHYRKERPSLTRAWLKERSPEDEQRILEEIRDGSPELWQMAFDESLRLLVASNNPPQVPELQALSTVYSQSKKDCDERRKTVTTNSGGYIQFDPKERRRLRNWILATISLLGIDREQFIARVPRNTYYWLVETELDGETLGFSSQDLQAVAVNLLQVKDWTCSKGENPVLGGNYCSGLPEMIAALEMTSSSHCAQS